MKHLLISVSARRRAESKAGKLERRCRCPLQASRVLRAFSFFFSLRLVGLPTQINLTLAFDHHHHPCFVQTTINLKQHSHAAIASQQHLETCPRRYHHLKGSICRLSSTRHPRTRQPISPSNHLIIISSLQRSDPRKHSVFMSILLSTIPRPSVNSPFARRQKPPYSVLHRSCT